MATAIMSAQECRHYLQDKDLTDTEIEQIRDNLVVLINTVFNRVLRNGD